MVLRFAAWCFWTHSLIRAGCHVDDVHLERVLHAPDRGLRGGVEVELRRLEGGASDTHAPALPVDAGRGGAVVT